MAYLDTMYIMVVENWIEDFIDLIGGKSGQYSLVFLVGGLVGSLSQTFPDQVPPPYLRYQWYWYRTPVVQDTTHLLLHQRHPSHAARLICPLTYPLTLCFRGPYPYPQWVGPGWDNALTWGHDWQLTSPRGVICFRHRAAHAPWRPCGAVLRRHCIVVVVGCRRSGRALKRHPGREWDAFLLIDLVECLAPVTFRGHFFIKIHLGRHLFLTSERIE